MPRLPHWGTPDRTKHYVIPRRTRFYVTVGLFLGGLLVALLMVFQKIGFNEPLSAGPVTSAHAPIEAQCQQCHSLGGGVSNLRCQRCHDPSGASTLSTGAHALYVSGNVERALEAGELLCAACHVEHRGRDHTLGTIDEAYCGGCHFRSFDAHPEFQILRTSGPEGRRAPEVTGLARFSHAGHFDAVKKKRNIERDASCFECHEYDGADFAPLSFERTCGTESCHVLGNDATEPLPLDAVMSPSAIRALAVPGDWSFRDEEFTIELDAISKITLRHEDDWISFNAARIHSRLDPADYLRSREELVTELGQLRRQQSLATPLAGLDEGRLRARQIALEAELTAIDARLLAQETAIAPGSDLSLVNVINEALAAVAEGDTRAEAQDIRADLNQTATANVPEGALSRGELEARRDEIYGLLDFLTEAAPDDAALGNDVDALRARVSSLVPGFSSRGLLESSRAQRLSELERVRDEISLRAEGVLPAANTLLLGQQRSLKRRAESALARLMKLPEWPTPAAPLDDDARQELSGVLDALTSSCSNACHVPLRAKVSVEAAARKLLRSTFVHSPHLLQTDGDCLRCHPSIVESKVAEDLNFEGIASCMECHGAGGIDDACQSCHFYHPSSGKW